MSEEKPAEATTEETTENVTEETVESVTEETTETVTEETTETVTEETTETEQSTDGDQKDERESVESVTETCAPSSSVPEGAQEEKTVNEPEKPQDDSDSRKRTGDVLEPEEKAKRTKAEPLMVMKMLCPFWCAGAVIGSKGDHIRKLKSETSCMIRITKNHENFPKTSERVVSIRGEVESIKKCVLAVQDKIRNDNPPPTAPSKDNSKRKGCMKLVVSVSSAGRIIGKGGEQTKKLQALHDVHVDVMKTSDLPPGLNESVVTISGDDNNKIDNCMADILALVSEDQRANLNYNVDYNALIPEKQPTRGSDFRQSSNQYPGWGSGPPPSYYPPPQWGPGNYPPYHHPPNSYRDNRSSRR